jgi:hypothetical protein
LELRSSLSLPGLGCSRRQLARTDVVCLPCSLYWKICNNNNNNNNNSVALVSERTILTERPKLAGEVSDNFCRYIYIYIRCHVVSAADPYGSNFGFLDCSRYSFFQVAPQLDSRGWVDTVPDPLLLRKSDRVGNRTRTSESVARNRHIHCSIHIKLLWWLNWEWLDRKE